MNKTHETFVKFAKIKKPHGIKGNVRVAFLPGGFFDLSQVKHLTFQIGGNFIDYEIDDIKGESSNPIIHFQNIINLEDAKFLQGMDAFVRESTLRDLGEELNIEYIGSKVLVHDGEKETEIGTVENITDGQHYDYLDITTNKGNEIMVPFVDGEFILKKSIKDKRISATNQTGIFDEEL